MNGRHTNRISWALALYATGIVCWILPVLATAENPNTANFGPAAPVSAVNDPNAADGCPIESTDGLDLVIASRRGDGGDNDIWTAHRDSIDGPWQAPVQLSDMINTDDDDFCPTPVDRYLFFVSTRTAACSGGNIYLAHQSLSGEWSEPQILPCAPDGPNFATMFSPSLVETDKATYLFYSSFGDTGDHDIYVSELGADGQFGPGQIVEALSRMGDDDRMPNVRHMGNGAYEVVYSSTRATWGPADLPSMGGQDVYRSVSHHLPFQWKEPVNLGSNVNSAESETRSTLSTDGERLYFGRSGEIYVSER